MGIALSAVSNDALLFRFKSSKCFSRALVSNLISAALVMEQPEPGSAGESRALDLGTDAITPHPAPSSSNYASLGGVSSEQESPLGATAEVSVDNCFKGSQASLSGKFPL